MVGRQQESGGDIYNIDSGETKEMISVTVYDETKSVLREAVSSDQLVIAPKSSPYPYYGVMIPKHWCKVYWSE